MSYFIPSFLQKRILRYALSRLELLDTDALDLENLDITWGKKSKVELKDVGVRTQKISALLQLPEVLSITRARILLLRLTVPSDLHRNGILVEVEGVDIHVKADFECSDHSPKPRGNNAETHSLNPSKAYKADRSRNSQYHVHDPGGTAQVQRRTEDLDDEEPSDQLPTTHDLAQSFLHTESRAEKEELQAALLQSQHLEGSQTSEVSADDSGDFGVGNDLSLPAFLADFLKGVVERIALRFADIRIDIDLKLDVPVLESVSNASGRIQNVTFRILIQELNVHSSEACVGGGLSSNLGSRVIELNGIDLMLVSESSLFSQVALSPVSSSPGTTHTSTIVTARNMSNSSPRIRESYPDDSRGSSNQEDDGGTPLRQSPHGNTLSDVQPQLLHTHSAPNIRQGGNSTVYPSHTSNEGHRSPLNNSVFSSSAHFAKDEQRRPLDTQPGLSKVGSPQAENSLSPQLSEFSAKHNDDQSPRRPSPPATFDAFSDPLGLLRAIPSPGPENVSEDPKSQLAEDLTESKLFSHEDASSLYMSATSETFPHVAEESPALPGAWQSTSSGEDNSTPPHLLLPQGAETDVKLVENYNSFSATFSVDAKPAASAFTGEDRSTSHVPENVARSSTKSSARSYSGSLKRDNSSFHDASSQVSSSSEGGDSPAMLVKRILAVDIMSITMSPQKQSEPDMKITKIYDSSIDVTQAITLGVGCIQIVGDMTLTKMIILAGQQVSLSVGESRLAVEKHPKRQTASKHPEYLLNLTVQTLSWKFLDAIRGQPLDDDAFSKTPISNTPIAENSEVLLRAELKMIHANYPSSKIASDTKITVGKVNFGYAASDIISFDPTVKMRESTGDASAPLHADVEMKVGKSGAVEVATLPLRVILDLRKLDETFNWFGGLSSMLGLGSSMVSTITLKEPKGYPGKPQKAKRGVHFEGIESSTLTSKTSLVDQRKVSARIGGLAFVMQGHQAALRLESTAVKLVLRAEGLGLQVDRLKLNGPYLEEKDKGVALLLTLSNIRLEYLFAPKEIDLSRLIELVSPSQLKDQDAFKDALMVDTMLRQRRKGGVLRMTIDDFEGNLTDLGKLYSLSSLTDDLKKLSTVAKYLPEDDRTGVLVLALLKSISFQAWLGEDFGTANLAITKLEAAQVTFPALAAFGIRSIKFDRNGNEDLVGTSVPSKADIDTNLPLMYARFIGNEMDPTIHVRIHDLRLEYHVRTVIAMMGLKEESSGEELLSNLVSSVATLTGTKAPERHSTQTSKQELPRSDATVSDVDLPGINLVMKDTIVGLNPRDSVAKAYVILEGINVVASIRRSKQIDASVEIIKASMLAINEKKGLTVVPNHETSGRYTDILAQEGFVQIGTLSASKTIAKVTDFKANTSADIQVHGGLLVIESCADSTQTLQHILSCLSPPTPKSKQLRYRTEAIPVEDMLASFSGNAYVTSEKSTLDEEEVLLDLEEGDIVNDEVPQNVEYLSSFYNPDSLEASRTVTDSMLDEDMGSTASPSWIREIGDQDLLRNSEEQAQVPPVNMSLDFQEDHFGVEQSTIRGAHEGNITQHLGSPSPYKAVTYPLQARVQDLHIIWNLFDGYDWQHTRDTISQAVADVQSKANERLSQKDKRKSSDPEDQADDIIGDFLFNSIYIGVPANSDPFELARQVNHDIDDLASETGSHATTMTSGSSGRQARSPAPKTRKLRLKRSRYHKMTFELKGVSCDVKVLPPNTEETQSAIDIRIRDLEIYDHVPTSTWKKVCHIYA